MEPAGWVHGAPDVYFPLDTTDNFTLKIGEGTVEDNKDIVIVPGLVREIVDYFYRLPTKLREGSVFTGVCLFTGGGGMPEPRSLLGLGGYA